MAAVICGSLAFDTIMSFEGRFAEQILPDQLHILNVSFLVPSLRRDFGGCAGNIAYSLAMLGGDPLIMATVGRDAEPYFERLQQLKLAAAHVRRVEETYTAQAFITTDLADNQITAFHPGAMDYSHHNSVKDAAGITLGIVAPDGREGMLLHAREFAQTGVPFILEKAVVGALAVVDYEPHEFDEAAVESLKRAATQLARRLSRQAPYLATSKRSSKA